MLRSALLTGLFLLAVTSASAALFSVEDGWTEADDSYASGEDFLTVSFGSALDSRYVFEASTFPDTYCLELQSTSDVSHTYLLDGFVAPAVGIWQPYTVTSFGNDWTVQTIGGTNTNCRFHVWKNKACDEWHADQTGASYPSGCEPDEVNYNLGEGDTDMITIGGDDLEVTCVAAGEHNYVKCQAPTFSDLEDCIDSSIAEDGGGDDFMLYDACVSSTSSSVDSTAVCDVQSGSSWEFAVFASSALSAQKQAVYLSGIPNATFNLYHYTGCGGGAFDRDLVDTVYLTQFTEKERVCAQPAYYASGRVEGWLPWFGGSDYVNESYTYGSSACSLGEVCFEQEPVDLDFDVDLDACFIEAGSTCYDGRRNQDENSTDYGGICGACDNSSKADDYRRAIAYGDRPFGYYGVENPFPTEACEDGENAAAFIVFLVVLVSVILLGVLTIIAGVLLGFSAVVGLSIVRYFRRIFKKKNPEDER